MSSSNYGPEDWEFYPPTPVPVDSCPPIYYEEPRQKPRGASLLSITVLVLLIVCLLAFVAAIGGIIGRYFLTHPSTGSERSTDCPCRDEQTKEVIHPAGRIGTPGQGSAAGNSKSDVAVEPVEKQEKSKERTQPAEVWTEGRNGADKRKPDGRGSSISKPIGGYVPTNAPTHQTHVTTPFFSTTTRNVIRSTSPRPRTTTPVKPSPASRERERKRIEESIRLSQQKDGAFTTTPQALTPSPTAPFSTVDAPEPIVRGTPRPTPPMSRADALLYRIPRSKMEPLHYDVTLQLQDDRLQGVVSLMVKLGQSTKHLGLHVVGVNIQSVHVTEPISRSDMYGEHGSWGIDQMHEVLTIGTTQTLQPDLVYNLTVRYDVPLCDNKAITCDADSMSSWATKLEPTYARYLYPCVDDPAAKATFSTKVIHAKARNYTVLSNEDRCRREETEQYYVDTFCKTPPMTTYNFAIVVGDFVSQCEHTATNVRLCIWMRPRWKSSLTFALYSTIDAFNRAQSYFKVPYKMSKLDVVGVYYYPSVAMENWGLVVHRINALAIEIGRSDMINDVIMHEVAHQWFGNHVTMSWWDDIWMNEGFAQYFGAFFRARSQPAQTNALLTYHVLQSMTLHAHPAYAAAVSTNHTSPDALSESFRGPGFLNIYVKGAAMVKMLRELTQRGKFRDAIVTFLQDYSFKSAATQDLLDSFQRYSRVHKSLLEIMLPWLRQVGYPEVHIWRNITSGEMIIYQHPANMFQHLNFVSTEAVEKSKLVWPIPITYKSQWAQKDKTSGIYWLMERSQDLVIPQFGTDEWLILNPGFHFLYRTKYDELTMELLIKQLKTDPTLISPESRALLLDDAIYFYLYDETRLLQLLDLLGYLERETEILPWSIGIDNLAVVFQVFKDSSIFPLLQIQFGPTIFRVMTLFENFSENRDLKELSAQREPFICLLACVIGAEECEKHANAPNVSIVHATTTLQFPDHPVCEYVYLTRHILHHAKDSDFESLLEAMGSEEYFEGSTAPNVFYMSLLCAPNRYFVHELLRLLVKWDQLGNVLATIMSTTPTTFEPCLYMTAELWLLLQELPPQHVRPLERPDYSGSQVVQFLIRTEEQANIARKILSPKLNDAVDMAQGRVDWVERIQNKLSRDLHKRLYTPHWNLKRTF